MSWSRWIRRRSHANQRLALPFQPHERHGRAAPRRRRPQRSKMMDYDQPLVWVVVLLAVRHGDGVFGVDRAARLARSTRSYTTTHFLMRQAIFIACRRCAGLSRSACRSRPGQVRAVAVRRHAGAAGAGAGAGHRQGRQRRAPLAVVQVSQPAAVRIDEARWWCCTRPTTRCASRSTCTS